MKYRIVETEGKFFPQFANSETNNWLPLTAKGLNTKEEAQVVADKHANSFKSVNEVVHDYIPNSQKQILLG